MSDAVLPDVWLDCCTVTRPNQYSVLRSDHRPECRTDGYFGDRGVILQKEQDIRSPAPMSGISTARSAVQGGRAAAPCSPITTAGGKTSVPGDEI